MSFPRTLLLIFACLVLLSASLHAQDAPEVTDDLPTSNAYTPILMMHGINGDDSDFSLMKALLEKKYPGILAIPLAVNNKIQSFNALPAQLMRLQDYIVQLQNERKFTDFHLVCHSQGGLLCRTLAASWTGHHIQKLVILSSPLVGQYGIPPAGYLPDVLKTITLREAYLILYRNVMQESFSVANFWKDPYHLDMYTTSNMFLTRLYNESTAAADIQRSYQFKDNFLRVKHVYMFASPADEVIIPWQSALLGFYQPGDSTKIVDMQNQVFFQRDYCGFRTMFEQKRLSQTTVPGVRHVGWIKDATIINKYIMPIFDQ